MFLVSSIGLPAYQWLLPTLYTKSKTANKTVKLDDWNAISTKKYTHIIYGVENGVYRSILGLREMKPLSCNV